MLFKLASAIEMSFEVPTSEKETAMAASERFDFVINAINQAKVHLDIMYNPFKKNESISTDAVIAHRGVISRYKKQVKKNFNKVKELSLKSIQLLNYFSTDTHTLEIINAFRDAVQDLEKHVVVFMDILDDYRSPDFRNNILSSIEGVKKYCSQVEKLIKDRIIDHIDTNILARNWTTSVGDQLHIKIQDKIPMITELFNERQNAINGVTSHVMPNIEKRPQTLNPGNTQRFFGATDERQSDGTGEY
jgi:hypothetical protein